LTARVTAQAGTKVGLSDPVVLNGRLELRIRGVKAEEKERTESTKRRIEYRPNRVEISSYGVTRARVYGVLNGKREREREREKEEE